MHGKGNYLHPWSKYNKTNTKSVNLTNKSLSPYFLCWNNFIIAHKIQFISFDKDKRIVSSGIAHHLDLRKSSDIETEFIKKKLPDETWLSSEIENEIK